MTRMGKTRRLSDLTKEMLAAAATDDPSFLQIYDNNHVACISYLSLLHSNHLQMLPPYKTTH